MRRRCVQSLVVITEFPYGSAVQRRRDRRVPISADFGKLDR
jgi:hypothetical protein